VYAALPHSARRKINVTALPDEKAEPSGNFAFVHHAEWS
jgi:hypothetical protein